MDTTRAIQAYCPMPVLYMAMELSASIWVLLFGDVQGRRRRVRVSAGDLQAVQVQIAQAKKRWGLADEAVVLSCYEAGRDGFWIHRWLASIGVQNRVVDAASIEVPQRAKRVKTDRIDAEKLLALLLRVCGGELGVWREVRVPTVEQEDRRRVHRERARLKKEGNGASNRIHGLLATQGVRLNPDRHFPQALQQARCWDGSALPELLRGELLRQWQRMQLLQQQLRDLERQQHQLQSQNMRRLQRLVAVGPQTAWLLCAELFDWRHFDNARQVGSLSGFTPTPYCSGSSQREQGISKAGIARLRPAMIELAWLWLRWQPESALSRWFHQRFDAGSRSKRIGIVALARKLLVVLWRYLHTGEEPAGVRFKQA